MKYHLTIDADSLGELQTILASGGLLGALTGNIGGGASFPILPPMPGNGSDDDETGTPAVIAAGTVDKSGFPWDERIHSSTKGTNNDGTWRKKRGIDAGTVATIENALRAAGYGVPAPTHAPSPPVSLPPPVAVVPLPASPPIPVTAPPIPIAAPVPVAVPMIPVAPPAQTTQQIDGPFIVAAMQRAINAGNFTADTMNKLAAEVGVTDMNTVLHDPAKMAQIYNIMVRDGLFIPAP